MIMPLMQYPHCTACSSIKAFCTGCGFSGEPNPSRVTIFCTGFSDESGVMQERMASPSTWTVHEPRHNRSAARAA
jgi:hypothetical protein